MHSTKCLQLRVPCSFVRLRQPLGIPHVHVRAQDLRKVLQRGGLEPDPAYVEGGDFLRSVGMTNQAEISRVLDIAMNPDSLFLSPKERRISGATARRLSVKEDMKPVLLFLQGLNISDEHIIKVDAPLEMISSHPCILGYSVEDRLVPVFDFLKSIGVQDPSISLAKRPSLFGLDVEQNLKKMVSYLEESDYPAEQIVEFLETSL